MMKARNDTRAGRAYDRWGRVRGFTLMELMIAMAAGLLIALAAFSFSRQATRSFAREARIASAQMSVLAGFQRLQSDVTRASYMSSTNFARDGSLNRVCSYNDPSLWPTGLTGQVGLNIAVQGTAGWPKVTPLPDNKYPDTIRIIGNLTTPEAYTAVAILPGQGSGHDVYIRINDGPSSRSGFVGLTGGQFDNVFVPGRILRVVDKQGRQHYQVIASRTWNNGQPYVSTRGRYAMKQEGANPLCAIDGIGENTQVNVVNIVEYGIANLAHIDNYQKTIYSAAGTALGDDTRTELVRREVFLGENATPAMTTDTSAIVVAEYAVDLRFGLWTTNTTIGSCANPAELLRYCPPSVDGITTLMAPSNVFTAQPTGPESVRAVQIRLVTRSRELDREADLVPVSPVPALTHGAIYRYPVTAGGHTMWARARTLIADVSLPNQRGDAWY